MTSDAAVPAAGDWSGVRLVTGSTGTLDWATVSWANNGVYATGAGTTATLNRVTASDNTYGVFVYNNAAATLTEVTASSNTDGLYVNWGNATQVDVSGGSFTGNNRYGVHLYGSGFAPSVTLSGASIHSNLGSHDLFTQSYNNGGPAGGAGAGQLVGHARPGGDWLADLRPAQQRRLAAGRLVRLAGRSGWDGGPRRGVSGPVDL